MATRRPIFRKLLPSVFLAIACGGCIVPPSTDAILEPPTPVIPVPAVEPLAMPRERTGCLPFPGLLTLYATADPENLGVHRYEDHRRFLTEDETERGIIYTRRAGFLDLAHLRLTIDYTRYCVARVRDAIDARQSEFTFNGSNGSLFHVTLHYPPDWDTQPPAERQQLAFELALRTGQRLAYLMQTWHETASWFGDHTFLFDESPSAFTWDDVMSHVVGVRIAETALRDPDRPFDDAVTVYLHDQLTALGAVSPPQTQQAVDAVEGLWWTHGRPLKRQFNIGLDSGWLTPWLVPDLSFARGAVAEPFSVPNLREVCGQDWSGFFTARIEPRTPAAERMHAGLPGLPDWFDVDRDLPAIMDLMRTQMREQSGPQVDVPWR